MLKWRIGDVTITRIVELETTGGSRFILPDATRDAILPIDWLRPHFADDDGRLRMSIHALVVETPTNRIVVDTCLGNDKRGGAFPRGTTCTSRSSPTSPPPATRAKRSTQCCAPICTSITLAGTPCWLTDAGARHSPTRAT